MNFLSRTTYTRTSKRVHFIPAIIIRYSLTTQLLLTRDTYTILSIECRNFPFGFLGKKVFPFPTIVILIRQTNIVN